MSWNWKYKAGNDAGYDTGIKKCLSIVKNRIVGCGNECLIAAILVQVPESHSQIGCNDSFKGIVFNLLLST